MLRVPSETLKAYKSLLATRKTPKTLYFHYQKWLRYYLDFCYKYHFPAHDRDGIMTRHNRHNGIIGTDLLVKKIHPLGSCGLYI